LNPDSPLKDHLEYVNWTRLGTPEHVQALAGAELPKEWNDPDAIRDVRSLNKLADVLKAQIKAGRVKKPQRGLYEATWYSPVKLRDKKRAPRRGKLCSTWDGLPQFGFGDMNAKFMSVILCFTMH